MNNLAIIKDGQVVMDSREVAEMLDKRHDHLLRDIKGYIEVLDQSPSLGTASFFIEDTYKNDNNQSYPCYLLTKLGCDMVANKMTGEKGILFTATYVKKFDEMEKSLNGNLLSRGFEGQLITMVNNLFEEKLGEAKEYYKIKTKSKCDISTYIKKRLGIEKANEEYDQVKARVFLILNISKWEDLSIENYRTVLPVVDESIRVIKMDRPQQQTFWG